MFAVCRYFFQQNPRENCSFYRVRFTGLFVVLGLLFINGKLDAQPVVTGYLPPQNHRSVPIISPITLSFNLPMSAGTASNSVIKTFGAYRGYLSGTGSYSGGGTPVITYTPAAQYKPGEKITTVIKNTAQSTGAVSILKPYVYEFTAKAGVGAGMFPTHFPGTPLSVPIGAVDPIAIASADMDGDGDIDIVMANNSSNNVSLFLNNGSGVFSVTNIPTVTTGRGITLGDLNNDGRMDIISASQSGNSVDIILNNGGGTFAAPVQYLVGISPRSVAIGDFNGDGALDLVCNGVSQASIFLNDGFSVFSAAPGSPYALNSASTSNGVGVADLDNDGDMDIALTDRTGNQVNILLNTNNTATFTEPVGSPFGTMCTNTDNLAIGDVNGDGFADVVIGGGSSQSVSVMLNNGAGSLTEAPGSPWSTASPTPRSPRSITLSDVNGDGFLDIVTGNNDGPFQQTLSVLFNNGGAMFTPALGSPFAISGDGLWSITAADFDGDGDIDIATANNGSDNVSIMRNAQPVTVENYAASALVLPARNSHNNAIATNINVKFTQPSSTATSSFGSAIMKVHGGFTGTRTGSYSGGGTGVLFFDPTKDFRAGEQVFVSVTHAHSTAGVPARPFTYGFRAKAGVGTAQFYQTSAPATAQPADLALGDLNGDGKIDIAVVNYTGPSVSVLLNMGSGNYSPPTVVNLTGLNPGGPRAIALGDFDNDGDLDMVVGNESSPGGQVVFLTNNGAGTFTQSGMPLAAGDFTVAVAVGDFNGDGRLDAVAANNNTHNVVVYLNNGGGSFSSTPFSTGAMTTPNGISVGDVDNDGDLDIVTADYSSNEISVLYNDGAGSFMNVTNFPTGIAGASPTSITLGDFDGDGDLDLATANNGVDNISVMLNNGVGNYSAAPGSPYPLSFLIMTVSNTLSAGDVDGDGDLDLIAVGPPNLVTVLLNTGNAQFSTGYANALVSASNPRAPSLADIDDDGDLDLVLAGTFSDNVFILKNSIQPTITALSPTRHTNSAPAGANITALWNVTMSTATVSATPQPRINIRGSWSGYRSLNGSFAGAGTQVTQFDPTRDFFPGEQVWVNVTNARSTEFVPAAPKSFVYRTKTAAAPFSFVQGAQYFFGGPLNTKFMAQGDFNGDGYSDLAVSITGLHQLGILLGGAGGTFTQQTIGLGSGQLPRDLCAGDFNNDGKTDLAVICVGSNEMIVFISGPGGFSHISYGLADPRGICTADLDSDGNLDLVVGRPGGGLLQAKKPDGQVTAGGSDLYYFKGSANGLFTQQGSFNGVKMPAPGSQQVVPADVDNDGDIDIVGINNDMAGQYLNVSLNDGTGNFYAGFSLSTGFIRYAYAADIDNDGDMDILTTVDNMAVPLFVVYVNNGSGQFAPVAHSEIGGTKALVEGDFDGDGDLDLVAARGDGAILKVLHSPGGLQFQQFDVRADALDLIAGDWDGDGDLDLAATNEGYVTIYLNRPPPTLQVNPSPIILGNAPVGTYNDVVVNIAGSGVFSPTTAVVTGATVVTLSSDTPVFTTQSSITTTQTPNFSGTLRLRFAPVTTGVITGNFVLTTTGASLSVVFAGNGTEALRPPSITSLSSTTVTAGATLFINGQNLTSTSTVTIGGINATNIMVLASTQVSVTVPQGTGGGTVYLTTPQGSASYNSVAIIPLPVIFGFSPIGASTGATVSISGVNLSSATGVYFGATKATIITSSATAINVTVPPTVSATNGVVSISVSALGGGLVTAATAFTYFTPQVYPVPVITQITPTSGTTNASLVLTGLNLGGALSVRVGGVQTQIFSNSQTEITSKIPSGISSSSASVKVEVTTQGGTATAATLLVLLPAQFDPELPIFSAVVPAVSAPDSVVAIFGTNLQNVVTVTFTNGMLTGISTPTIISSTQLTVKIPASGLIESGKIRGLLTLVLTNIRGNTSANNVLTIIAPPTISSFTPNFSGIGGFVTLNGTNFAEILGVSVGGAKAVVKDSSLTQLTIITPASLTNANVPASGFISLTTAGGTAVSQSILNPIQPPVITTVTPDNLMPGQSFSITGNFLLNTNNLLIGGVPVREFTVQSITSITGVLSQSASRTSTGTVELTTPNGTALANVRFGESLYHDSLSLVRMFHTMGGAGWKNSSGWNTSTDVNRWFGVTVQNNRIVALRMPANNISGTIPEDLKTLTALKDLQLNNNNLSGNLPDGLQQLRNLESIQLANNQLSGALQNAVCGLPKLKKIHLSNNQFAGTIPACISTLTAAEEIYLNNNKLSGDIPSELGVIPLLKVLVLNNNNLTGTIPPSFFSTTAAAFQKSRSGTILAVNDLTILDLRNNKLSGEIPARLGTIKSLTTLLLDGNSFSGALPSECTNLKNLVTLGISNNQLTVLPNLTALRALDTMYLSGNKFQFPSFEINSALQGISVYSIQPQQAISAALDTTITAGQNFSRTVVASGSNNTYQWVKKQQGTQTDWTEISGQTSATLTLFSLGIADSGLYCCRITNPLVQNLTLESGTITVNVTELPVPPAAPVLISPVSGAQYESLQPVFVWKKVSNASLYTVELSLNATFDTMLGSFSVPAQSGDSVRWNSAPALTLLKSGVLYYWRVKAQNTVGTGAASEIRSFRTIPDGSELVLLPLRFPKTAIGDVATLKATIRNVSDRTLKLDSLHIQTGTFSTMFSIDPITNLTFTARQERTIEVRYNPRSAGEANVSVGLRYSAGATSVSYTISDIFSGSGTVVKIDTLNFGTVLNGMNNLNGLQIQNRGTSALTIHQMVWVTNPGSVFRIEDNPINSVGTGDTVIIPMYCRPAGSLELEYKARLFVFTSADTVEVPVLAASRNRRTDDLLISASVKTSRDTVNPGDTVYIELSVANVQRDILFSATTPQYQGIISFDKNVLQYVGPPSKARILRNGESSQHKTQLQIIPDFWNGNDLTILRLPFLVVLGDTDRTAITLEQFLWGGQGLQPQLNQRPVFVESIKNTTFVSGVCRIDGTARLIRPTKLTVLLSITPNPAFDLLQVLYSLRENGSTLLTLHDVTGAQLKSKLLSAQQAGEHQIDLDVRDLATGVYTLVITTQTARISTVVQILR